jgi:hypothetical protein
VPAGSDAGPRRAPQARGRFTADWTADVWALGVTAIEALTGAHPLLPRPVGGGDGDDGGGDGGSDGGGGVCGAAVLYRVGRLSCPPGLDPAWRLPDGRLRAFLDGALALRRGERRGPGGPPRWDAAGATPPRLLGRMRRAGRAAGGGRP